MTVFDGPPTLPTLVSGSPDAPRPRSIPDARRTRSRQPEYAIQALTWPEARQDREILAAWRELLRIETPPSALHSSPEWVDHLVTTGTTGVVVLVARQPDGRVAAIMPMKRHRFILGYAHRSRVVPLSRLAVACVLGNVPLAPDDQAPRAQLIEGALGLLAECNAIYFDALPLTSPFSELFETHAVSTSSILPYRLDASRHAHSVALDGSFEDYVGRASSKSRYNVKRAIRQLKAQGRLELLCCRSTEHLGDFMLAAAEVQRRSWQHEVFPALGGDFARYAKELRDLAQRGFLRSYLLRCAGTPCAFVIGYQGHGVYHYWEIGYDHRFARYSPGTVLLHLLLEDLFSADRPRVLDFGRGDDDYKRRFGTRTTPVVSGLLFRPTRVNRLRIEAHRLVSSSAERIQSAWKRIGNIAGGPPVST